MFLSPLRKSFNTTKSSSSSSSSIMYHQNHHENNSSSRSIDWKLYNNPHYSFSAQKVLFKSPSSCSSTKKSELENAMAEIKDLKAELEYEKQTRKKAEESCERLMKELVEERKARDEGRNGIRKENLGAAEKVVRTRKLECVENPHIKRGINGVEFFRATRAKESFGKFGEQGRVSSGANLECQRAQLRVLMRYKSSVGNGVNFVM